MARYWVYLNDEVSGPFALEQLIRVRGFSRQTQVCIDDASGKPTHWISPAEIPELAHIFKAADEHLIAPAPVPKAVPKPAAPRAPRPYTPAVVLRTAKRSSAYVWASVILTGSLLAGGIFAWSHYAGRDVLAKEKETAKALVENARLPASSLYGTLQQYIQDKGIKPRWETEKVQDALYNVTASWYAPTLTVYAFEANVQAQTVRGLNTAASKLLSEGFPVPATSKPKPAPAKKAPAELFSEAIDSRRAALESGDFSAVWNSFSPRKKSEMAKAGISEEGFTRLQGLTRRVDSAVKQTVLKTKQESETEMLALIKQTQDGRPDIFIKQLWVFDQGGWKLDDEQKKSAGAVSTPKSEVPSPKSEPGAPDIGPATRPAADPSVSPRTQDAPSAPAPAPAALPGMSN